MRALSVITLLAAFVFPSGYASASPPINISAEELQTLQTQAAQGDADAENNPVVLYASGQGVPQDYATARQWFEKAAAQGSVAQAQNNLGLLYYKGQGVPKDYTKARQWWEKAAAQGFSTAQNQLGWLHRGGQGVPQNDMRAYMWFNIAAAHSTGDAQKLAVDNRDEVARRMTPAQIAEAQRLTSQCQARQFKGC